MADEHDAAERDDEARQAHGRLFLPLLIPAVVFLFSVLLIYGLSRIYLELDTYEVGEVSMATPLAIGVALAILLIATYLATHPRVPRWQIGSIVMLAAALLTAGGIWAAVHEEGEAESVVTPPDGTPTDATPVEGAVEVQLIDPDWAVTAEPASAPAGSVTMNVTNAGSLVHNFRLIQTDLAPEALPVDEAAFQVDESQVDVVAQTSEVPVGQSEQVAVELDVGSYVLICNIPSHYQNGMHTAFTVE